MQSFSDIDRDIREGCQIASEVGQRHAESPPICILGYIGRSQEFAIKIALRLEETHAHEHGAGPPPQRPGRVRIAAEGVHLVP